MLTELFDASGFTPKIRCGPGWTSFLVFIAQTANYIIVFAYYAIVLQMYYLYKKRRNQIHNPVIFQLFITFPFVCGISRICTIISFYYAPYRFYILCDWLCAIGAAILAFKLYGALDYLISLPSVEQERKNNELLRKQIIQIKRTEEELQFANRNKDLMIDKLNHILETEMWIHDRHQALAELSSMLEVLEHGRN